jgi:mono/diheme cytochrome c family protein
MKKNILVPALFVFIFLVATAILSGCASPQVSAFHPTPIPTLLPATMPSNRIEPTSTPALIIESFPAGIPSAADGQALYIEHCTRCHGVDGQGRVPNARNFGDEDYMRGETPLDFYLAITEGVANTEGLEDEMPAFAEELSSDERWDLVYYVWRFSTNKQRLEIGEEIFTAFCEECHGEDGRSQILNAADLSDQRFIAHQSPSTLYLSVTRGRGSMPAWQARLSQDERWMVIEYLRSFSYDPQLPEQETPQGIEEDTAEEESSCDPSYVGQANPFGWTDSDAVTAGADIYEQECAECHAVDGTGNLAGTGDFTNPAFTGGLVDNPDDYLCLVAEGINRMPSFNDTLTEAQIWQVLSFIESLGE